LREFSITYKWITFEIILFYRVDLSLITTGLHTRINTTIPVTSRHQFGSAVLWGARNSCSFDAHNLNESSSSCCMQYVLDVNSVKKALTRVTSLIKFRARLKMSNSFDININEKGYRAGQNC
jgi:hypothetical protein